MTPVLLDGVATDPAQARVGLASDAFQFGYGLFETLRFQGGGPAFFEDHAARLARGCAALGLIPPEPVVSAERIRRSIELTGRSAGALKWIRYRREDGQTGEMIHERNPSHRDEDYATGFALEVVPGNGGGEWKALAYLPHLMARRRAKENGAQEALYVDLQGNVLEGSATNIFAVESGRVVTPPCDGRILPGIARLQVLRLGAARQEPLSLERLKAADEAFVTNALVGVMPVSRIGERAYSMAANPVTREFRRLFEARAAGAPRG